DVQRALGRAREIALDVRRVGLQRGPVGAAQPAERLEDDAAAGEPPGRRCAAADEGEGAEEAFGRDEPRVGAEEELAGAPAEEDRLECAQQTRRRQLLGRRSPGEVDEAVLALLELRGDRR